MAEKLDYSMWPGLEGQHSQTLKEQESAKIAEQVARFLAAGGRIQQCSDVTEQEMSLEQQVVKACRTSALTFQQLAKRFGISAEQVRKIVRSSRIHDLTISPNGLRG